MLQLRDVHDMLELEPLPSRLAEVLISDPGSWIAVVRADIVVGLHVQDNHASPRHSCRP